MCNSQWLGTNRFNDERGLGNSLALLRRNSFDPLTQVMLCLATLLCHALSSIILTWTTKHGKQFGSKVSSFQGCTEHDSANTLGGSKPGRLARHVEAPPQPQADGVCGGRAKAKLKITSCLWPERRDQHQVGPPRDQESGGLLGNQGGAGWTWVHNLKRVHITSTLKLARRFLIFGCEAHILLLAHYLQESPSNSYLEKPQAAISAFHHSGKLSAQSGKTRLGPKNLLEAILAISWKHWKNDEKCAKNDKISYVFQDNAPWTFKLIPFSIMVQLPPFLFAAVPDGHPAAFSHQLVRSVDFQWGVQGFMLQSIVLSASLVVNACAIPHWFM